MYIKEFPKSEVNFSITLPSSKLEGPSSENNLFGSQCSKLTAFEIDKIIKRNQKIRKNMRMMSFSIQAQNCSQGSH